MSPVKAIPDGFHCITPHLVVEDPIAAIAFYKEAFNAEETFRMKGPDGESCIHAEILIGDSKVMLSGEFSGGDTLSPKSLGGTSVSIHLYCQDVDLAFEQATRAGCEVTMPIFDSFWGDRFGKLKDPFGHTWSLSTRVKDLSNQEIEEASRQFFASS
jgi:PhnB protein